MDLVHTQTRTTAGSLYRVRDEVTVATDLPKQVFVFQTDTQEFSRVASVEDLLGLPASREAALAESSKYYRADVVQRDFESMAVAGDFGVALKRDLKYLVVEYNRAIALFLGTDTETLKP